MSGIHVLSDILKGGNKLEKTSTPKGKDSSDSSENATAVFAAMFSGFMNSNVDSKGQNSKADQESEEKQSADNPVQSVQNSTGQGSMQGYANFALSNLIQPMLQSDLPAGKEANSGNDVSQRTGAMNLVSLASDEGSAQSGMTTPIPQGDNPGITELDKYRQVIADLLGVLSGEITDKSSKGNRLSLEGAGTMDLRQEMAKIVQGWMTLTDVVAKGGQGTSGQTIESVEIPKALQEGGATIANSSLNKAFDSLGQFYTNSVALSPKGNLISSENTGVKDLRQEMAKIVQGWMTVTDDVAENGSISTYQKGIQSLLDVLLNTGVGSGNPVLSVKVSSLLAALNPILSQEVKDAKTPQRVNGTTLDVEDVILDPAGKGSSELLVPKKSEVMFPQENTIAKVFKGAFRDQKDDSLQSTEVSGVKGIKNQNPSAGIGVASNLVAANVADGKTVAIPVWEQISSVIREQVMNRFQDLKQLDIQLHPADLGKIQIDLRWENGQVHLQVQASQASTGQLLQNQLPDLRQALVNHGVNCGMLQMGQGGDQRQNHRQDEPQRMLNHNINLNEDEDPIPVINPLALGQDGNNRINVTA